VILRELVLLPFAGDALSYGLFFGKFTADSI
jgi:hypothetical protein